ncbi:hypothetical protein [Zunongwangia sp.]|uniref:hypothetical protein n=1 Tax=Zunongwangia sp. TaxID=1965325 RepID=UPI003AA7CBA3
MREDKNIDRLFQERFKDFEASPNEKVWKNLAQELQKKQTKKYRILPFWYKLGGVAAILVILLSGSYFIGVFDNSQDQNLEITFEVDQNLLPKIEKITPNPDFQKSLNTLESISENRQKQDDFQNLKGSNNSISKPSKSTTNLIDSKDLLATTENSENTTSSKIDSKIPDNQKEEKSSEVEDSENLLEKIQQQKEQIAKNEENETDKNIKITDSEKGKIIITPVAAPVYYGNLGSGNPVDASFAKNNNSSDITMSYGLKIAYAVSKKVKIRSGVNKVNLQFKTKDINYSYMTAAKNINNIDYQESATNIQIRSNVSSGNLMSDPVNNSESFSNLVNSPTENGTINQQFGYIEVPVEVAYQLASNKFGVTVIAGASSLFLQENNIGINSKTGNVDLGKSNNLKDVSFTTNIGIGLDYQLTNQFKLNIEPTFKYQLNSFNNVNNVKPYIFGVYTGISFEF